MPAMGEELIIEGEEEEIEEPEEGEEEDGPIEVIEEEEDGELDMERSLTEQMGGSWKDEAWTIFFIAVLTACFLPWTQEYVREGFIFLDTSTPDWFANCIYISIAASFGYRIGKAGVGMINSVKRAPSQPVKKKKG